MSKEIISYKQLSQVPCLDTYMHKPVQNFGISMLKTMGYKQGQSLGKSKNLKSIEPIKLKARPKGQGLGVEKEDQTDNKKQFEVGNYIVINQGMHSSLTGIVMAVKEKNILVQLLKSGSKLKISKSMCKRITKQELKQLKNSENHVKQKIKNKKWVLPNIRVKVANKSSQYYLKKLIINEILSDIEFECLLVDNRGSQFIRGIRQRDIQTVVPSVGGLVMILKGDYQGHLGNIVERSKQRVMVRTHSQLQIVNLEQDDVCQYVEM